MKAQKNAARLVIGAKVNVRNSQAVTSAVVGSAGSSSYTGGKGDLVDVIPNKTVMSILGSINQKFTALQIDSADLKQEVKRKVRGSLSSYIPLSLV